MKNSFEKLLVLDFRPCGKLRRGQVKSYPNSAELTQAHRAICTTNLVGGSGSTLAKVNFRSFFSTSIVGGPVICRGVMSF